MVKNLPAMRETWVSSLDWEDPLEKEMATHSSIIMPGKSHGQRSLVGYSPWGRKESDTTEQLKHTQTEKANSGDRNRIKIPLIRINIHGLTSPIKMMLD